MITTKQIWILGALFATSGAVWAPRFLGTSSRGTAAQVGLDGPSQAEMLEMDAEFEEMFAEDTAGPTGPPARPQRDPSEVDGPDEIVGSILGALGTSDVFSSEARHQTLQGIAADWARESGDIGAVARTPLAAFLDDNPLRGTMTGASSRIAMFGSYMLREGDTIPGTTALIAKVDRNAVVVEDDGASLQVALPPLRASERYARRRIAPGGGPVTVIDDQETMLTPEGGDQ